MSWSRVRRVVAAAALVLMGVAQYACASAQDRKVAPPDDPEVRLGRENAAENDKTVKLITDAAVLDRVNKIGQAIAAVANTIDVPVFWGQPSKKAFAYTFKVVDDKDVNAYSLPGGFIYVNKGLLAFVKSDDELAGVLAHEVAHAAHHHMMKLIAEQEKIQQRIILPTILAAVLGGANTNTLGTFALAGQLYTVARLNTYGIEAEKDADQAGVRFLMKTGYNPVGLLTFMERLAREERLKPQMELGIYRTHPPSPERAEALVAELRELGVPIYRRETDPSLAASVDTGSGEETALAEVTMSRTIVARVAAEGSETARTRAERIAGRLNRLFDEGLQMVDLRLSTDKTRIIARSETLIAFTQADADAQKQTVQQIASGAYDTLRNLIWQDQFNRIRSSSDGG
ncbi:MAG: M48 family metalloprotease [Chthonomonadales bacterium]|nr:M48 family metalloprotease [Chthonomonadales bacterium]